MKTKIPLIMASVQVCLTWLLLTGLLAAAPLDLTVPGAISSLKESTPAGCRPYNETYNLGATGLRGWICLDTGNPDSGSHGLMTDLSRQILVTAADAPGNAELQVDDLILGATGNADSGEVPEFASDCRKALGMAIGAAEANNPAVLRVKRWRAGVTTDVNITMETLGSYSGSSPFACDKTDRILAKGREVLLSKLFNNELLGSYFAGGIHGLALLAVFRPGDPRYEDVQVRLKGLAHELVGVDYGTDGLPTWNWGYTGVFLSEYYLRTVADGAPDAVALQGILRFTSTLVANQSRYGTYGHGGCGPNVDGSPNGGVPPYGPVNSAGLVANIAIVLGKKAILAGGMTVDPSVDRAIERGAKFSAYFVNKGSMPYGEQRPFTEGHASNGKDSMSAILLGLQPNRIVETEYFTRMSLAGYTGREYGHTGQDFSFLWSGLGANVGGQLAMTKYMENIRWQLDLARRTDGSFVSWGQEQFGAGKTDGNTYMGNNPQSIFNATASFLLSYSVALRRINLTGIDAIAANTLPAEKVNQSIMAGSFKQDAVGYSNAQLIDGLGDYDPIVRSETATLLGSRSLSADELNSVIAKAGGTNANERMAACETLGYLKPASALPLLSERLSDPDLWVRALAAKALGDYGGGAASQINPMLAALAANATDPDAIVWDDPVQIANGFLSRAIGDGGLGEAANAADKSLFYPAVRAALAHPDSLLRHRFSEFTDSMSKTDVQAMAPEFFAVAATTAQANSMWHNWARESGIKVLQKYQVAEAIPIALAMQVNEPFFNWGSERFNIAGLRALETFQDSARWTLPILRDILKTKNPNDSVYYAMAGTIENLERATSSPEGITPFNAVANSQVVTTTGGPVSVTLTGSSCRGTNVAFGGHTLPLHGKLTGTAPNLVYTPIPGYRGPDYFTFRVADTRTTSESGTVSIIVGSAGTGPKIEYLTNASMGSQTSGPMKRWTGQLLIPETTDYIFSTLNSLGVRLYINGNCVIDNSNSQTLSWKDSTAISLAAGQKVEIQWEYFDTTGNTPAKLKWTGPSFAGRNGEIIAKKWLFDGTGLTSRQAYAHGQSLSMLPNTVRPILLQGSGISQTQPVYSIVTQPSHGTLSGSGPNVSYTPATGYNGTDSFTFIVNNGTMNSAPATVSIDISDTLQVAYYWSQATSGNWSGNLWKNIAGGPVALPAAGDAACSLNFNQAGSYTTTHDLNNDFKFNQLNFAAAVTVDGSNQLVPSAVGLRMPQINLDGQSSVTINTPVKLASLTRFGGNGTGELDLTGIISGTGGLVLDNRGTLKITGVPSESDIPYSGGTTVNSGMLHVGIPVWESPLRVNPWGTGPLTLNSGGTIKIQYVNANNPLILNGGTIISQHWFGASMSGPVALNGTVAIEVNENSFNIIGDIRGEGGITKSGGAELTLSGDNSYSGKNRVKAGILKCTTAASLGSGTLEILNGARVDLSFSGNRTVAGLILNGAPMPVGTYGSSASSATFKNDSYFVAGRSGIITVTVAAQGLQVTNGLVLKMDASEISGLRDGAQLDAWRDTSGQNNNALRQRTSNYGYPKYIADGINGRPVVRFNSSSANTGDYLRFNRISNIRSVFWVMKENAGVPDGRFLLGDSSSYDFHRNGAPNGPLWDGWYASPNILNGTTKLMGNVINGTTTALPFGNFQLVSLVTTGDVSANQLCQDRTAHGSWQGEIAEILIYDRALSAAEEQQVGSYLGEKYGLVTAYNPLPISNGLVLRMDASQISGVAEGGQVNSWADTSGLANNAVRQSASSAGWPKWISNGVNGRPVVRFKSDGTVVGDYFKFNRIADIRSVFWVLKENAGANGRRFLLGDDTSYDFHRGGVNGALWDASYAHPNIKLGTTKLGGNTVDGTTTSLPSGNFQLVSLVTAGKVEANQLCQDRNSHGSWQGDIAEMLVYNRPLTGAEVAVMNRHLATKYGLVTDGLLPSTPATPNNLSAVADVSGSIRVSWAPVPGATSYTVWSQNTQNALERITYSVTSPCLVTGLVVGTAYEFKVSAVYPTALTSNYSSSVMATPRGTSPFSTWASDTTQGLTAGVNMDAGNDPDGDGISNLMEFVLGGAPMNANRGILPVLSRQASGWIFEYNRSDASEPGTTQVVEYGNDLTGWTAMTVNANGSSEVSITPGNPYDRVKVSLPAGPGKMFVRLKVSE